MIINQLPYINTALLRNGTVKEFLLKEPQKSLCQNRAWEQV